MKPAIIFDMNGVLVDSEPLSEDHFKKFLQQLGHTGPKKITTNVRGLNITAFVTVLREELGLKQDFDELKAAYRKSYYSYLKALPALLAVPGVIQLVKQLHRLGYRLAIGSSGGPARIEFFLTKLEIKEYFPIVVSGDDITHSKPHPEIFLLTAARLETKPKDCIVIEDSNNGVRAAKAAGMQCIGYAGSSHNSDDLSGADVIITDFEALTNSLEQGVITV